MRQRRVLLHREQLKPPERLVADDDREGPAVGGDVLGRRWSDLGVGILIGRGESLPLVDQAAVDVADQRAEPLDDVVDLVGANRRRHRLDHRLVDVGEVPQQDTLGALEPVVVDVLLERHRSLEHVADHRLRSHGVAADPRVVL